MTHSRSCVFRPALLPLATARLSPLLQINSESHKKHNQLQSIQASSISCKSHTIIQNSTVIQQVHNYKHTLRNLTTHSRCVCSGLLSFNRPHQDYKQSNKTKYYLSDLHSGEPSPDDTTLTQVLDPHKHYGPYQLIDGSFAALHSELQTHYKNKSLLPSSEFSGQPHGGGRCRVCTHRTKPL